MEIWKKIASEMATYLEVKWRGQGHNYITWLKFKKAYLNIKRVWVHGLKNSRLLTLLFKAVYK